MTWALHVSHKDLRNPNRSIPIYVGLISNIRGNNFTKAVVSQHIARGHALMGCMVLRLVGILVPLWYDWVLHDL